MNDDTSPDRHRFNQRRRYVRIRRQQGRPRFDADLNEQAELVGSALVADVPDATKTLIYLEVYQGHVTAATTSNFMRPRSMNPTP